ncbi:FG-GAP and VCBS repeat-containing protein [Streptomyces sp. NPDC087270]|uniref:FG-GAP and VCBS repeat-containing protein n=1 Tax=Streptomyces sp. NPDC087270 TaxID=3365774 RepID=UPI0037FDDD4B
MSQRIPRRAHRLALAAAVAVVSAVVAPAAVAQAAPGGTAHAATAGAKATQKAQVVDFNGDGHADMAVGSPYGTASGKSEAGYVSVVYGAAGGVDQAKHYLFAQDSPGIPGGSEALDRFGSTVVPVDLNGDGYTDLVVGASGEDIGTDASGVDAGMLTVLWGSASGLGNATAIDTGATAHAGVGAFLQAGDFNGDGKQELVTSYGSQTLRTLSGIGTDGKVASVSDLNLWDMEGGDTVSLHSIAAGDINGDGTTDLVALVTDTDEPDSYRGYLLLGGANGFTYTGYAKQTSGMRVPGQSVAIGDVNGDGYGDIVFGHSTDYYDSDEDLPVKGGAVTIVYGGAHGQSTTLPPVWINQDTPGVPGVGETGDAMGASVAVGDVNGDGYADVVAGVPGEDYDGLTNAGSFLLLLGSSKGVTGTGSQVFTQNSDGVPGASESGDKFGAVVGALPATPSDPAQVVIGDPDENAGTGAVWVLHGTTTGLTGTGTANFGSSTMGTSGVGAYFGEELSTTPADVDINEGV